MNTVQFSENELKSIVKIAEECNVAIDTNASVKQNMVNILKARYTDMEDEKAKNIAAELLDGVVSYNEAFEKFCSNEEVNIMDLLRENTKDMSLKDKATAIVNFIAVIKSLDAAVISDTMSDTSINLMDQFEDFVSETSLEISDAIDEEQVLQLENLLEQTLKDSCICLAGDAQLKDLLKGVSVDKTEIEAYLTSVHDLIDKKAYTAIAAYIAVKEGKVDCNVDETPLEVLGASVAAGMDKVEIISKAEAGLISWETAKKLLMFIGSALLTVFMMWVIARVAITLIGGGILFCSFVLNSVTIGTIMGIIMGAVLGAKAAGYIIDDLLPDCVIKSLADGFNYAIEAMKPALETAKEALIAFKNKTSELYHAVEKVLFPNSDVIPIIVTE